jgi:hypothetical protein
VDKFESDIDKSLRSLRNQGVLIGDTIVSAEGKFIYSIGGFLLTAEQILMLRSQERLTLAGIREFSISETEVVEKDVQAARRRFQPEEFKKLTPGQICTYINREFGRNHSVGQIVAVLAYLGIQHA